MLTLKQVAQLKQVRHFFCGFMALMFTLLGSTSSAASYVGDIYEWIDHRDGTSTIVVICEPGERKVYVTGFQNEKLKLTPVVKLIEQLDAKCRETGTK